MTDKKYTEDELKELSIEEANTVLSEEQFEHWAELHNKKLEEQAEENWKNIQEDNEEAIDTLVKASKDELIEEIEVMGAILKINVSLNKKQKELFSKIQKLQKRADKSKDDETRLAKLDEMEQNIYEFLGEICVDYSSADWRSRFEDIGLTAIMQVTKKIMDAYSEKVKDKQGKVKKFRE